MLEPANISSMVRIWTLGKMARKAHGVGDLASAFDDVLVGVFGVQVPLPGVFEGGDLGS